MTKIIEPLDPEGVKAALAEDQNKAPVPPISSPIANSSTPAPPPTSETSSPVPAATQQPAFPTSATIPQPYQPNLDNPGKHKRKRYKIIKLVALFFIIIVAGLLIWHFWIAPNKKSGKTILGTSDKTTLAGANKQSASQQDDYQTPPPPIKIPDARQAYSIENGGFRYTFKFLKNAQKHDYKDADLQDVIAPAGSNSITVWVQPADQQRELTCEGDGDNDFTLKTTSILGQTYPLCASNKDSRTISNAYSAHFLCLGTWHDFLIYSLTDRAFFSDKLATDVLNSLTVQKL